MLPGSVGDAARLFVCIFVPSTCTSTCFSSLFVFAERPKNFRVGLLILVVGQRLDHHLVFTRREVLLAAALS